ncbi:MAG: hypothetical protein V1725_04655 [archaeon]
MTTYYALGVENITEEPARYPYLLYSEEGHFRTASLDDLADAFCHLHLAEAGLAFNTSVQYVWTEKQELCRVRLLSADERTTLEQHLLTYKERLKEHDREPKYD